MAKWKKCSETGEVGLFNPKSELVLELCGTSLNLPLPIEVIPKTKLQAGRVMSCGMDIHHEQKIRTKPEEEQVLDVCNGGNQCSTFRFSLASIIGSLYNKY